LKLFFDTSTLVAALIQAHPAHHQAIARLQRVNAGLDTGCAAVHSIAELYAVLTAYPIRPRIAPTLARQLIRQNVFTQFEIIALDPTDYVAVIEQLAESGISGGATYDALILSAAYKANVDQILTLNEGDFRRLRPDLSDRITTP
jgi:predicted nucleic acid-binding protein